MRLQKNTRLAPINEVSLICRQLRRSLRVGENAEKGLPSSFILKHHFHHDVVIDTVRLVLEERGEGFKIRHLAWGDGLVWGAVAHVMPDVMKREFGAHELVYQWDVFVFVVVDKMLDCGAGLAPDVCDEVESHCCWLIELSVEGFKSYWKCGLEYNNNRTKLDGFQKGVLLITC